MNLSIVIPQSSTDFCKKVSTFHSPYFFPAVPKNINKKLFDWEDDYKIKEFYNHVENLVVILDTKFENSFYKQFSP